MRLSLLTWSVDLYNFLFFPAKRSAPRHEFSRVPTWLIVICCLACPSLLMAQQNQYTKNTPDQTMRSDARVDPSSHALSVQIPLAGYAGRAGLDLPVSISYSSKIWHVELDGDYEPAHGYGLYYLNYARDEDERSVKGWTTSLRRPRVEYTFQDESYEGIGANLGQAGGTPGYKQFVPRIRIVMGDGSSHEMRKDDVPRVLTSFSSYTTGTYYAVDGSQLRYEFGAPSTLYLPDGSRYLFSSQDASQYIDRNGNTINYSGGVWTDTRGHTFASPLEATSVGEHQYSVPGFNNTSLVYTFKWSYLRDPQTQETVLTNPDEELRYPGNWDCSNFNNGFAHVSPSLFSNNDQRNPLCAHDRYNPVVLAQVTLPNGKSYRFTYNAWGEIDKVYFPTGGYERYQYGPMAPMSFTKQPFDATNRGVTDRWVSTDGTSEDEVLHHWHYGLEFTAYSSSPYVTTITDPAGTTSKRYLLSQADPYDGNGYHSIPYGFDDARSGLAYEERVYDANSVMLQRSLTEWLENGPTTPDGWSTATRDPRVTKQVEILLDPAGGNALAKTTTFAYDQDLNRILTNEYGYVAIDSNTAQTAAIGTIAATNNLLRTTEVTYLVNDQSIDANTRAAYRARNLLALPTVTRVKDSGGNIVAQSFVSYDEAAYPLLTAGSTSGWSDPGSVVRGNATTVGRWLNTTNTYLATHFQYDQFGNVRKSWEARDTSLSNPTQVEYSSAYQYSLPTTSTSAVPDSSGQSGSSVALVTTTVYDASTGLVTAITDANNQTINIGYTDLQTGVVDPLNRIRTVTQPDGGLITYNYNDTPGAMNVQTLTKQDATRNLETLQQFDGLGKPRRSFLNVGGSSYQTQDTKYDALGRVWKVSNPYLSAGAGSAVNPSGKWSTTVYDALGRMVSVTTSDGAPVTTAYGMSSSNVLGTTAMVTDQAGKLRRSLTDALGRLVRVDEPDNNGNLGAVSSPNQPTSYAYDVQGNLRAVTQGSQQRFFTYDSLSRLLWARQPELAVNANLPSLTDPITGNSQWSLGYQYDNNGNLTQKTDARGVVSTYSYDGLNRSLSVVYTSDPNGTPAITRTYDGATNGKGKLWKTETAGDKKSRTTLNSFDLAGRPLSQSQQFYENGVWSAAFSLTATYDKVGHLLTQAYPSGHSVSYNYDSAGRLADQDAQHPAFGGNLGDGMARTYASDLKYTETGAMQQEKFATDTPLYHKQRFNERGQLWDLRLSTKSLAADAADGDRGALVNYYSNNFAPGGAGTDNNGNLLRQEIYIPGSSFLQQNFTYDSLNRLTSVAEKINGTGNNSFMQAYLYDRWGNRTIDQTNTTGDGINKKEFTVNTTNNRLGVPGGQTGTMVYDAAGNLTTDTYSGAAVTRVYDAENRLTSETQTNNYLAGSYTYNAEGQCVRRKAEGSETWQVYGLGGELLAEYAANASYATPQKEYGYRNGQLLITAAPQALANLALAANGATISASSTLGAQAAANAINGDHKGIGSGWWTDNTSGDYPDSLVVDFGGPRTISEIDVYGLQQNPNSPVEPTLGMTSSYALTNFDVQYWTGSAWAMVPSGSVTGNDKVWRKFNFASLTTSKIRIQVNYVAGDNHTQIVELEAFGPLPAVNVALTANGATSSASSVYGSQATANVNNGEKKGLNFGWWTDNTSDAYADWVQVDFNGSKTINEIDVLGLQDPWSSPVDPTLELTARYALTNFQVQYWTGSAFVDVPGGSVTGNDKVWRKFIFDPISTSKIRVNVTNVAGDNHTQVVELEAWTPATGGPELNWLVTDQLGTPRIEVDRTGSLLTTRRHDYLPFGEEVFGSGRTAAQGYTDDKVRQKFTEQERDSETGIDYFEARYYASVQGRFTSPDPTLQSVSGNNPQTWNRYSYVMNSPLAGCGKTKHC